MRTRLKLAVVISIVFLQSFASAAEQDLPCQFNSPGPDLDLDGITDDFEVCLAEKYSPQLRFHGIQFLAIIAKLEQCNFPTPCLRLADRLDVRLDQAHIQHSLLHCRCSCQFPKDVRAAHVGIP